MLWWIAGLPVGVLLLVAGAGVLYQVVASAVQLRRCPPPGVEQPEAIVAAIRKIALEIAPQNG
jgi:hypothetical protein